MRSESYDLASIRKSLRTTFTARELRAFCQDNEAFQPLLRQFGPKDSLDEMIDTLLEHCYRRRLFPELQAALEDREAEMEEPPYVDEGFTIVARVIQQAGHCAAGHRVGDQVIFDSETVQGKVCIHALYSFLPKIFAMRYGAEFPWTEEADVATHACPDAWNPVVFEIRRIRE